MNLNKSRVITISTNASLVKVAQSAGGVVEKLAKKNIDNGALDAALRQALTGFDIKSSAIVWVLPAEVATSKSLEIPSTDNDEIEAILNLQAPRHTPFSKDEILISFLKTGAIKSNFTQVLLVIVKREAIKEKLGVLKSVGVPMSTVLFAPEAVARFYVKALNGKKNDASFAIIDVNIQNTNFIVQANGVLVMSRNIPIGLEHLVVDAEAQKSLSDEIKVSLDAYDQEGVYRKPGKFYLTTVHPALAGLPPFISTTLGIQVESLPYSKFVKGSKIIQQVLTRDFSDDSALDIIAAAVMASQCQVELIPQEIRDQRSVAEKGRETLKAGIFILCSLVFFGFALLSKVYFRDQFLQRQLITKYSAQRQEVKNLESLITRTGILREYLTNRSLPLETIRELYRIIPQEIFLSAINIDDTGMVSIQGVSNSISEVYNFVTALQASPLFQGVKAKSTSSKKDRGKEVTSFEIIMKVVLVDAPLVPGAAPEKKEAVQ